MKILLILLFLIGVLHVKSQVAINTDDSNPDNSSMLDVKSMNKGVLIPRMTSAERNAIVSPAVGLILYDLTNQSYWYYNGVSWAVIGNSPWAINGNNINSINSGSVGIGTSAPTGKLHVLSSAFPNLNLQGSSNSGTWLSIGNTSAGGTWYNMISTGSGDAAGPGKLLFTKGTGAGNSANTVMTFLATGNVGIATTAPALSAALDVSSASKGFLPPRMTTAQRNTIESPVEGLVIYNTEENGLNVYNGNSWKSMAPPPKPFACGLNIIVNHLVSGGVAPVNKTVEYGTVNGIPGEPAKCWITSNLGADRQALSVNDATEASAGWYWQFNLKQGYKHDGTIHTPGTTWITFIDEYSDWMNVNDPCMAELGNGWRVPTFTEWENVDVSGSWTDWNGPWNSELKLHAAGRLLNSSGSLHARGEVGNYWSSVEYFSTLGWSMWFYFADSKTYPFSKTMGFSLRCIKDN